MKKKSFPHVAEQTHEVFHPTTSSSKMDKNKNWVFRDDT